jgi:hypothetical protein
MTKQTALIFLNQKNQGKNFSVGGWGSRLENTSVAFGDKNIQA